MSLRLSSPVRRLPFAIALTLVALLALGGLITAGQRIAAAQDGALAIGSAQVIAQGVVPFTGEALDWRVYELVADPDAPRDPFAAAAGFTLANDGPLLVADDTTGRRTLLAPGEAALSYDGDLLRIDAAGGEPVTYTRLVLLPDDYVDEPGTEPSFESEGFETGALSHDVNLLRAVLDEGESMEAPQGAAPTLLFVTDGEVEVAGDGEPATLAAGEATALTGPATIAQTGSEPATLVAAVIGDRVADDGTVESPEDEEATPDTDTEADATPVGEEPGEDAGAGSVTLAIELCPLGGVTEGCDVRGEAALLELSGPLDEPLTSDAGALTDEGYVSLAGLPFGEYELQVVDLVTLADVQVSGDGVGATDDPLRYTLTLDEATPDALVSVQVLPAAGEGELAVGFYRCPSSLPVQEAQPWFCSPDTAGWSVSVTSSAFGGELTSAGASATEDGVIFSGLPLGSYSVVLTSLPDNVQAIGVRPGVIAEGPIRIELSGDVPTQQVSYLGISDVESLPEDATDSDGDGLPDTYETEVYGTDPAGEDTDGDTVPDGKEVADGTNPLDPESYAFG